MARCENTVVKLRELQVAARSAGDKIDVAALYAENVVKGVEGLAAQEFGLYADKDSFLETVKNGFINLYSTCVLCKQLNDMVGHPFAEEPRLEEEPCRLSCWHYWSGDMEWPWLCVDRGIKTRVLCAVFSIMWFRLKRAIGEGQDARNGEWRVELAKDLDEVSSKACDAVRRKIERVKKEEESPTADGFKRSDRKKLSLLYRRGVLRETPTDAQKEGETRRRQVLYGARLYKPSTRYKQGVSFREAAKRTIKALELKDKQGAYSLRDIDTLAQAIRREYNANKADSAT